MFSVNSVDTACSVQPKRPREIELFDFVFRVQTEVACTSMRHLSMVTKNGQAHVCQCEIDYSHCWVSYYYIAVFSKNTGGNWLEHVVVVTMWIQQYACISGHDQFLSTQINGQCPHNRTHFRLTQFKLIL